MIHDPIILIAVLLLIEVGVLYLANLPRCSKFFNVLPSVFWIYFLPMLASSMGLIDSKAEIYSKITTYLLPMALVLLLMTVDIKGIMRLGPTALGMFFAGALGIMLGIVIVFILFKDWVGVEFSSGFAALCASWTGGSANMIAVKEALRVPEDVFLPMVIVDTIVPYVWMASLIAAVRFAPIFDRWNCSDKRISDDLDQRIQNTPIIAKGKLAFFPALGLVFLACVVAIVSIKLGHFMPVLEGVVSTYAWTIIIVSCMGILLSLTPARKWEAQGANKIGYFILYFVLTSIGAKASITDVSNVLTLLVAGFIVVLIHAMVLLLAARIMHAPLFLVAAASQANIGGVASAPVVAEIYKKGFASVGLLMAILGNIIGTYLGILVGQICQFFK